MISINDIPIISGQLDYQFRGPWVAQLDVAEGELEAGDCVISDGTVDMAGTIGFIGQNGARISVGVTGGKGGMGTLIKARHYKAAKVSLIVADICKDAGESVSPAIAFDLKSQTLPFWSTPAGKCGSSLTMLANYLGTTWGVDNDGGILLGYDTGADSKQDLIILESDYAGGNFTVAPEGFPIKPGMIQQDSPIKAVEYTIGKSVRAKYWLK